jgi:hypothetical protein
MPWSYPDDEKPDKLDVVAVLEIPPVVSPEMAVKAAIATRVNAAR